MSELKHTPGPWRCIGDDNGFGQRILSAEDDPVASGMLEADARRIVTCVNALEGATDEEILKIGVAREGFWGMRAAICNFKKIDAEARCAQLLEALLAQDDLSRTGIANAEIGEYERVRRLRLDALHAMGVDRV